MSQRYHIEAFSALKNLERNGQHVHGRLDDRRIDARLEYETLQPRNSMPTGASQICFLRKPYIYKDNYMQILLPPLPIQYRTRTPHIRPPIYILPDTRMHRDPLQLHIRAILARRSRHMKRLRCRRRQCPIRIIDRLEPVIVCPGRGKGKFGPGRRLRVAFRDTAFDFAEEALHEGFEEWEAAADDGDVEFEGGPDGFFGAGGWGGSVGIARKWNGEKRTRKIGDDEVAEFDQAHETEDADPGWSVTLGKS